MNDGFGGIRTREKQETSPAIPFFLSSKSGGAEDKIIARQMRFMQKLICGKILPAGASSVLTPIILLNEHSL
jgi:hypothetical protein